MKLFQNKKNMFLIGLLRRFNKLIYINCIYQFLRYKHYVMLAKYAFCQSSLFFPTSSKKGTLSCLGETMQVLCMGLTTSSPSLHLQPAEWAYLPHIASEVIQSSNLNDYFRQGQGTQARTPETSGIVGK